MILLLLQAGTGGQAPASADRFDAILRNGSIIDGTGGPPFRADIAIVGGHIARVGDLSRVTAAVDLDVAGLYVAPGFINLHSHASPAALPTAENMLTQGVTTEILNPDGGGRTDLADQLTQAGSAGLALNIGAYIGFNSAWRAIVGEADRRPTPEEIARMRDIVTGNLEAGAWGVSAGLDYKPAYFATAEEVVEVLRAAAPYRTNFTNHDRLTPETNYSSRAGVAETIGIASRADLVPMITHMKVQGREQGSAATTLRLMRDATARGNYTAADVYPYLAGQTGLGALLIPGWAQDGGRERMLERFKDVATRARIVAEAEEAMTARFGGAQGVYLPATRRELVDVMKEMDASAGEAVVRLLEEGNQGAILRFGAEEDLVRLLQHPTSAIACDCGASPPGRGSHPRNNGTYPRVLGHYVRDVKALTWADAIRKMTLLPAVTVGMIDRGAIAAGMAADITVFDPATITDRATYEEPTLVSEGIRHVIVNGVMALRDGKPTGERSGRVLRRAKYMPSRPMPTTNRRRITAQGLVTAAGHTEPWRVTIDVTQDRAARSAKGTLKIVDSTRAAVLDTRDFGLLQTAPAWGSVTARARVNASGEYRPVTVVVQGADPWMDDRAASVTIVVEGSFEATGRGRVRVTGR
jgi:N-acyl-D-aspartate/D-glutamate deacylase